MANIVVTGATGLLGSSLVPFLQERGHQVTRLGHTQPADLNADLRGVHDPHDERATMLEATMGEIDDSCASAVSAAEEAAAIERWFDSVSLTSEYAARARPPAVTAEWFIVFKVNTWSKNSPHSLEITHVNGNVIGACVILLRTMHTRQNQSLMHFCCPVCSHRLALH